MFVPRIGSDRRTSGTSLLVMRGGFKEKIHLAAL